MEPAELLTQATRFNVYVYVYVYVERGRDVRQAGETDRRIKTEIYLITALTDMWGAVSYPQFNAYGRWNGSSNMFDVLASE